MSAVPRIVLTECLPASLAPSQSPMSDLANHLMEENPTRDVTGHRVVCKPTVLREGLAGGCALQQEKYLLDGSFKQEMALLLTERELRVVSPHEAQQLRRTGVVLQTLTVSSQTEQISEAELSERPVLMLFKKENNPKDAYKLLHSLLELSKPVPKPRMKFSHQPSQRRSLTEALKRGMETGEGTVMLLADEIKTQQSSLDGSSADSLVSRRRSTPDVRLSAYKRLDSLEETIRELENTLIELGGHPTADDLYAEATRTSPRTSSLTSETKRPPVPPKPSSIQVHCFLPLCEFSAPFLLFASSLRVSTGTLLFKLLMSVP